MAEETIGKLIPRQKSSKSDLESAKVYLDNGDLKAAAVYARSAFEWKLRKVCENHRIKISFEPDADKIDVGVLWDGIILRQREREEQKKKSAQIPDFVPAALETSVNTMRSTVLNKLSYTGTSGLVHFEVANAITTVESVFAHDFPKA